MRFRRLARRRNSACISGVTRVCSTSLFASFGGSGFRPPPGARLRFNSTALIFVHSRVAETIYNAQQQKHPEGALFTNGTAPCAKAKPITVVDDIDHQRPHLCVTDPGEGVPLNFAVRVDNFHVGEIIACELGAFPA